jgi:flagellin
VASRNTAEASSLLQVAEGALDQIGNMLTRLKELATQAASANAGSNLNKINAEGDALIDEIERVATSTEYANTKLINGTFGVGISSTSTATVGVGVSNAVGMVAAETYNITTAVGTGAGVINVTVTTGNGSQTINGITVPGVGATSSISFSAFGLTLTFNSNLTSTSAGYILGNPSGNATFQVGSENETDNKIVISLGNATVGASGLNLAKGQLSAAGTAQSFLTTVDSAIGTLSTVRGNIGASTNRLTYASANLAVTIENVQAAESVIRDVDMAAEMTMFTKNQILLQASTAMLAQANMAPQSVLSLFGG